jgi:hypothetical protein
LYAQAIYPLAARATPYVLRQMPAYLILLQMEVTAFHIHARKRLLVSVALFLTLYLADFSVRPLAVIPLYAARTFLPPNIQEHSGGDCLVSFKRILTRPEIHPETIHFLRIFCSNG